MPCEIDTLRSAARSARLEQAWINVRQQPGLIEHQTGGLGEIRQRGCVAETVERLARRAIAQLGLIAEREQRLVAARIAPGAGDRKHRLA